MEKTEGLNMILVRSATLADAPVLGKIHYSSWMETYTGLIDSKFLQSRSPSQSADKFLKDGLRNFLVAEVDGEIVGYSAYGPCRDQDLEETGEIYALYILKKAQKLGVGKRLLEFAVRLMGDKNQFSLWVLETNQNAIQFYQHCGFIPDGKMKIQRVEETLLKEIRMVRKKPVFSRTRRMS
jgi:ribosomal protein S18 acetylase RimI-like enzyme